MLCTTLPLLSASILGSASLLGMNTLPAEGAIAELAATTAHESALQDATPKAVKEKPKRRILYTAGGGILRGSSRRNEEGNWEIKLKRGWTDLPAASVDSAVLETELLDELDSHKKNTGLAPADLLEWALNAGLLQEAFALGDRLMAEFPRDGDLRMVAAGQASRFVAGLPKRGSEGELEALRELGARGSELVSEAIVERLSTAAPRAEVLAALQEDLASRKSGRRQFASRALGRLFPTEDPRALLLHAIHDPSVDVRRGAALGLADMGASEVCGPLVRALGSKSGAVRQRASEALGHTREAIFVEPLIDRMYTLSAAGSSGGAKRPPRGYVFIGTHRAYVQDFDVEVAAGSSVADPTVNTLLEGSVLGASVISSVTVSVTVERRSLLGALTLAAGQTPGRGRIGDWKKWWESDASAGFRNAPK